MSKETFLARVPLFANCTSEEITAVATVAQESTFQPGQIIVGEVSFHRRQATGSAQPTASCRR
jgi:hypothetical protein